MWALQFPRVACPDEGGSVTSYGMFQCGTWLPSPSPHDAWSGCAGDGTMHRGEVLAYKEENGQHQVFYEDGEDEWVDLAAQKIATWQEPVRGVVSAPGLPEGSQKEQLCHPSSDIYIYVHSYV